MAGGPAVSKNIVNLYLQTISRHRTTGEALSQLSDPVLVRLVHTVTKVADRDHQLHFNDNIPEMEKEPRRLGMTFSRRHRE